MKALLLSLGTRGDIEPFLALAEKLKNQDHEVICAFPIQFQSIVEELNFQFFGLSEKFLLLLEGEKAKLVLGGKGNLFKKLSALIWMIRVSQQMQKEVIIQQRDLIAKHQPDIVVYNQKCLFPIVWGMVNPGKTTMLSPIPCTLHAYSGHASLGMGSDHGAFLNKFTYRFSNFFLYQTIKSSNKRYQQELGLKLSNYQIKNQLLYQEKMIYTVSPSIFPRPGSWTNNVQVVGYHQRNQERSWEPTEKLLDFLKKNKKIVFITFGSMTNPNPGGKTADIIDVLSKHKISAIINIASGGLEKPDKYPEHVFFIDDIPYDWIFPKMYAVIHHGGSGTTHSAIKNGCSSMIIPHILDQHLWNDIISQKELGPKGFPVKRWSKKRFEQKLLKLINTSSFKQKAEDLGKEMQVEDLEDQYLNMILKL